MNPEKQSPKVESQAYQLCPAIFEVELVNGCIPQFYECLACWEKLRRERRLKIYNRAVPSTYREIDPERLPAEFPMWRAEAERYEFGRRGLAFIGPTGTGKTLCMTTQVLRRLCLEEGKLLLSVSGIQLAQDVMTIVSGNAQPGVTLEGYLQPLIGAEVLFLDDLNKGVWTQHPAAALYRILDERRGEGRPLFFTSNTLRNELSKVFGQRGEAIVTRLADSSAIARMPRMQIKKARP